MAGADGIAAHLLEELNLTLKGADVDRAAERSEVGMIADAIDPHMFSVQEKSFIGVELDRADAERCFITVQ